jgi:acetyl esterase/lipase
MRYDDNMDPQLRPGLSVVEQLGFGDEFTIEDVRAIRARGRERTARTREDRLIPGPDGTSELRLRIYRPLDALSILPCLYWIHGGGMILGTVEEDDVECEWYAGHVGCVVVSVEYRLAPEHPHPAPVEDCYAGLRWTAMAASELGVDPARIAVGGASAGGGLAAATVLLARDRGGPAVAFQLLIYPMLDDRNATPSAVEFTGIPTWSHEHNRFGWQALLGEDAGGADVPAYAAPARAENLSDLPPALIQVGELDVFRDEDIDYATRMLRAGVATELHVYPGAFHGWDIFCPTADASIQARDERLRGLRRALHPDAAGYGAAPSA